MVPRYARPEMTAIWSAENRFRIWFEIEAHATDALAELGTVPKSAAKALWDWWATNPTIDVAAINAMGPRAFFDAPDELVEPAPAVKLT